MFIKCKTAICWGQPLSISYTLNSVLCLHTFIDKVEPADGEVNQWHCSEEIILRADHSLQTKLAKICNFSIKILRSVNFLVLHEFKSVSWMIFNSENSKFCYWKSIENVDVATCDEKYWLVSCLLNPAGALINWQ